jgi:hypothetical protein
MSHPYLFPFFLPCFALAVPMLMLEECWCQRNIDAREIPVPERFWCLVVCRPCSLRLDVSTLASLRNESEVAD